MSSIFLKLGDMKGGSTDGEHKDWFELSRACYSVSNNTQVSSDSAHISHGTPNFSVIDCMRTSGVGSGNLLFATMTSDVIPKATIQYCATMKDGKQHVYRQIELQDCVITGYTDEVIDERPAQEHFYLSYATIKVESTPLNRVDGKPGTKEGPQGWDLTKNQKL